MKCYLLPLTLYCFAMVGMRPNRGSHSCTEHAETCEVLHFSTSLSRTSNTLCLHNLHNARATGGFSYQVKSVYMCQISCCLSGFSGTTLGLSGFPGTIFWDYLLGLSGLPGTPGAYRTSLLYQTMLRGVLVYQQ